MRLPLLTRPLVGALVALSGCATARTGSVEQPTTDASAKRAAPSTTARASTPHSGPWYHGCDAAPLTCRRLAPRAIACPAERDAIVPGEVCGLEGVTPPRVCAFESGRCRCVHHVPCGGARPSYLQQQGMIWECAPPPREGDCPDEPPVAGAACTPTREACGTTGCGSSQVCRCEAGRWACQTQRWEGPP